MTRTVEQPGFILHRYEYGETSLVLECFTQDCGRLGVLARGARRPSSGLRSLAAFEPLLLSWSGRGELPVLTQAEVEGAAMGLSGRSLWCGFYLNELVLTLLHRHDPHPGLFHAYARALNQIGDNLLQEQALRLFELELLRELGYGLMLATEAQHGTAVDPDALYTYVFEFGPLRQRRGEGGGVPVYGRTLLALNAGCLGSDEARCQAKILLQTAIGRLLRAPLRTPALFRRVNVRNTAAVVSS